MRLTRRSFLKQAGYAGCAALVAGATPSWAAPDARLKGTIHAIGWRGSEYAHTAANINTLISLLTSLDLATGAIKQTVLPINNGHSAMGLGDGRILCLPQIFAAGQIVDADHKVISTFKAPKGYAYGGHGIVLPERNLVALLMRRKQTKSLTDVGAIELYDLTTLKKLDQIDSGGLQPHEIHIVPNNPGEMAISHYGDLSGPTGPLDYTVADAKLTIIDSATFKPKRHYQHNEFNAICGHMQVDKDGWACAVFNQYIRIPGLPPSMAHGDEVGPAARAIAVEELERHFGQKWDFPISNDYFEFNKFDMFLPMLRINTQTGESEVVDVGARNQLRSQSVGYNPETGYAIGVYRHSKTLILHKRGSKPEIITAKQLGLNGLSGITNLAGTSCIAVNAPLEGITVYDLKARRIIRTYDIKTYDSTHLFHSSDIGI